MDEATSSIDIVTEEKIQTALNKFLNKSTVITIAHRIKTILHYDRILVLSYGEVMEFDAPQNLLNNPNSMFTALFNESQHH